jgi:hypothetical protein
MTKAGLRSKRPRSAVDHKARQRQARVEFGPGVTTSKDPESALQLPKRVPTRSPLHDRPAKACPSGRAAPRSANRSADRGGRFGRRAIAEVLRNPTIVSRGAIETIS